MKRIFVPSFGLGLEFTPLRAFRQMILVESLERVIT